MPKEELIPFSGSLGRVETRAGKNDYCDFFLSLCLAPWHWGLIAFALLICAVAMMVQMNNFDAGILAQNLMEGANNYPLMAVPFFMLTGELMNAGVVCPNASLTWPMH